MKTSKLVSGILLSLFSLTSVQGTRVVREVMEGSGDFEGELENIDTKILPVDNILEEIAQKVNDEEVTTTTAQVSANPKDVPESMSSTEENDDVKEMEMNSSENTDIDSYEETWNQVSDNIVETDAKGDIFEQQKCHKCLRTIWQANHKEFCNQCETRSIIELGRQRKQLKERCGKCDREKFKERHLLFCQDSCNGVENEIIEKESLEKVNSEKKNKKKEKRRKDKVKDEKTKSKNKSKNKKIQKPQNEKNDDKKQEEAIRKIKKDNKHKQMKKPSVKKPNTKRTKTKSQDVEKSKVKKNSTKNKKKHEEKQSELQTDEIDTLTLENEVLPVNNEAELGTIGKLIQYWISRNTPGLEG